MESVQIEVKRIQTKLNQAKLTHKTDNDQEERNYEEKKKTLNVLRNCLNSEERKKKWNHEYRNSDEESNRILVKTWRRKLKVLWNWCNKLIKSGKIVFGAFIKCCSFDVS